MKNIIIILMSFILGLNLPSFALANTNGVNSSSITIKKGTFLKGFSQSEISTSMYDIGDEVCFINSLDMYADNTNVIPEGSKLLGFVEDIREPVQGTNAAIKIKITKIIRPDRTELHINGYIYNENDNYIGGEITPPMYYSRTPTYYKGLEKGVLQYTPTNIRFNGQPTMIKAGAELFVIILDDLKIN